MKLLNFFKSLFKKKPDPNNVNNLDEQLTFASRVGHTKVVKLLLNAGANVHAWNDTALRLASHYGHTEIVKILLNAGADVHARDDYALRLASEKGRTEVIKVLKEHGAR